MTEKIVIYCDGACSGNQFTTNKGGWGIVMMYKQRVRELHGGQHNTTNQRMELTSCIRALEQVKTTNIPIEIYSDSAYLVNCMQQEWHKKWAQNGWKNVKKKAVENKDLWQQLLILLEKYEVTFHKVAGHRGVEMNERADELARQSIEELA